MCKYCGKNAGYILEKFSDNYACRYGAHCKGCNCFVVSSVTKESVLYRDVFARAGIDSRASFQYEDFARAAILEVHDV